MDLKKVWMLVLAVLLLAGCAGDAPEAELTALRAALDKAQRVVFTAQVSANYIDSVEQFTLDCSADGSGNVEFTVGLPQEISGIRGTVSGETGSLEFEDTVLAFPLMARERISPVSGPWILLRALDRGSVAACVREGELLHVTVEDTFSGAELTVELWLSGTELTAGEIAYQGIRQMSLIIDDFRLE